MGDLSLGQLVGIIFGSGVLGFIGLVLSSRTGRQRDFDARVDSDLARARADLTAANARIQVLEDEGDTRRVEETRLRVLLVSHGIDPDSSPKGRQ